MGDKLRRADEGLWALVDWLTFIFFIAIPVLALVVGIPWLLLTD